MQAEGELRSNLDESDSVRELQDKVADLKAEVSWSAQQHSNVPFSHYTQISS
jgi:hypothetical protein